MTNRYGEIIRDGTERGCLILGMKPRAVLLFLALAAFAQADPIPLFNGKDLDGWEGDKGKVWRVEDGVIKGGSMEGNPRNEFLTSEKEYGNFRLTFDYKLVGTEGFVNGGVQIRSHRMEGSHEMIGYQADIGADKTGFLYDESRRNKMLAEADLEQIKKLEKPGEWNHYEVLAEGKRVRLFINGKLTVDYTEEDDSIGQKGLIGLQIHGDCKAVIAFRNIHIEPIPATTTEP